MNASFQFLGNVPYTPEKCTHSTKDQKDLISLTEFGLDETAAKGKVNNITIKGTLSEYQDIEKITIKTYLLGIRMDKRNVPSDQSLDEGEEFVFKYGVEIPSIAPRGSYTVQLEVKNVEDEVIACWGMKL